MTSLQERSNTKPAERTVFGLPLGLRFWSEVGAKFWGGVVLGISIGLLLCLVLIELGAITPRKGEWSGLGVTITVLVLGWIGIAITSKAHAA